MLQATIALPGLDVTYPTAHLIIVTPPHRGLWGSVPVGPTRKGNPSMKFLS